MKEPASTPASYANASVTCREIAEACRVGTETVRVWVRTGKIPPGVKIGKTRLWPASVIDDILSGRATATEGA